ncbi:hypothetical protein BS47DRAFT_1254573, partial [Hydnum rufescens UP504]
PTIRHSHWRYGAAHKWNTIILPNLIHPYMAFCVATNSGRDCVPSPPKMNPCSCGEPNVRLEVTCVRLKCVDSIVLYVCKCLPAPRQLIEHGLFPCALVFPKLTVELDMLEFAAGLFVNLAPNEMAWAVTLTEFLSTRGYIFT